MHVGLSCFFQNPDKKLTDREVWLQEVALAEAAEPMGFDSIWSAEHHFTDYTMCPSVTQFLTYMAGRTTRVGLGTMVVVLPWHEPVRIAEELALLDHLSGGRTIFGMGRGLGRVEFEGFRLEMGESRERFVEYAEAVMRALETGTMESDGKHLRQPATDIRPAPFKSFRGPHLCRLGLAAIGGDHGPARHRHPHHRPEALGEDAGGAGELPRALPPAQ